MPNLTELIKRAATEAVAAGDPACIITGILQADGTVHVDQKMDIPAEQIRYAATARNVEVTVTVDGHSGRGTALLGVSPGDRVVLIRQNGGQEYLLISRAG